MAAFRQQKEALFNKRYMIDNYIAVLRGNMKQVMAAISKGANVKQVDESEN